MRYFGFGPVYLAGLLTIGVKGHLFNGKLSARVGVIAEVNLAEGSAAQQLPLTPVHRRPRSYTRTHTHIQTTVT